MLFITFYEVIGSRCNGAYIVNAETATEANRTVKALDPTYVKVKSMTREEYGDPLGFDDMVSDIGELAPGAAVQVMDGT